MNTEREDRHWIPPVPFVEALSQRVLPIYVELLKDPGVRDGPLSPNWDDRTQSGGRPLGPWEVGREPLPTDVDELLLVLEKRVERLEQSRHEPGGPDAEFLSMHLDRLKLQIPIRDDYIERFYNPIRRHSTLGYLSPVDFEREVKVA